MKQTRRILIKNKVFWLKDLQRIGQLFKKQQDHSRDLDQHSATSFQIDFSDNTSIESDSIDIISEESITRSGRPVQVRFSFCNYKLHCQMSFSLSHGDSQFGNDAAISGEVQDWVSTNFVDLKEAIDSVRSQSLWLKRHENFVLHIMAIGVGCIFMLAVDLIMPHVFEFTGIANEIMTWKINTSHREILLRLTPFIFIFNLMLAWLFGLCCGAFQIRSWLLSLWPNIELYFGAEHLNIEAMRRRRLFAVIVLVVIPIFVNIVYGVIKASP